MLRKSLAVVGLLSAMTLASPAGALSWDGGFFGKDRGSSLRFSSEGSSFLQFFPVSGDRLGSWQNRSDRPRRSNRDFRAGRRHPFTGGTWNCSDGAGALLVGRRLRSR